MHVRWIIFGIAFVVAYATAFAADPPPVVEPVEVKFEKEIAKFEAQDKDSSHTPPAEGQILFVGSSSIRLWKLAESFPKLDALNRGFGGSHISDCVHFANRIVVPYKPRQIVFYAGDNDLHSGKSPEQVAKDFRIFVETIRKDLRDVPILCLGVKPSPSRLKNIEKQKTANKLIREFCESQPHLSYVDIFSLMLDAEGNPLPDIFREDKLHMNDAGYKLWTEKLKPLLKN